MVARAFPTAPEVKERYHAALARQPSRYAPWVLLGLVVSTLSLMLTSALTPLFGKRRVARVRVRPAPWRMADELPLGRRARRKKARTAAIAVMMAAIFIVGPEQLYALNNEAARAIAARGYMALGTTVTTYAYDDNGNQISKQVDQQAATLYTFDAENRLTQFDPQTVAADIATYDYDADGVRRSKTVNSVMTYHLTDKNRAIVSRARAPARDGNRRTACTNACTEYRESLHQTVNCRRIERSSTTERGERNVLH